MNTITRISFKGFNNNFKKYFTTKARNGFLFDYEVKEIQWNL